MSVLTILNIQIVLRWRIGKQPELLKRKGGEEKEAALTARVATSPRPLGPESVLCLGPSLPLPLPLSPTLLRHIFSSLYLFFSLDSSVLSK